MNSGPTGFVGAVRAAANGVPRALFRNGLPESKEVVIDYRSNTNESGHKLRTRQLRCHFQPFLQCLVRRLITFGRGQRLA